MEQEVIKKTKENNRLKKFIVALIVCLICVVGAGGYFVWQGLHKTPEFSDDLSAKKGLLKNMTKEEIQQVLNASVKDGYVNVYINSNPIFEDGTKPGNIYIQNIPANKLGYRVKVTLDDTQNVIMETGYIAPGYNVEYQKLKEPLKKGDYKATAEFTCFKNKDEKLPVSKTDVKIKLTIQH